MKQLDFFGSLSLDHNKNRYIISDFSHESFCEEKERRRLEEKYVHKLEISEDINRQSVSFQFNKNKRVHSWLKYKEGFSASLVESFIEVMDLRDDDIILDPFLGSGTTGLVSQMKGYNSVGFDILPTSKIAIQAKERIFDYELAEVNCFIETLKNLEIPKNYAKKTNVINITEGAYPEITDGELAYLKGWISNNGFSDKLNNLFLLCMLNCLEDLSYTRKDGQYLRWDYRSKKVIDANRLRLENGKGPFVTILDKGEMKSTIPTIIDELNSIRDDIAYVQNNYKQNDKKIHFSQASALHKLPLFEQNSFGGVITSPPYCNRYDYTRTYALELAFLGMTNSEIKKLRQSLLSCTVENKSKEESLRQYYQDIGEIEHFKRIDSIIKNNKVFCEINNALRKRSKNGDLNNKGVISMVRGYFYELGLIYAEIYRTCRNGAKVYFVNDNVRYGGEVIPVDYLSSELAEEFGYIVEKIYTIKQLKGNSSQQMKRYGRVPLRKSITVWTVNK